MYDDDDTLHVRWNVHGLAPWGLVCYHLVTGTSREWLPGLESENDWQCPECAAQPEPPEDNVRLVCVRCIRSLQRQYDPKFTSSTHPDATT